VGEIERLFQCVICGAAFAGKQSLRAHMKVHKGEYVRTTIYAKRGLWKKFDEVCRKHKTTTCRVLQALIEAAIKGEELGAVNLSKIAAPNPVIININQTFLGKPRSAYKTLLSEVIHETSLECEVCGEPAHALHSKRLPWGWAHITVCEDHHREAERSFYGDCWIPLEKAEIRKSHMGHVQWS